MPILIPAITNAAAERLGCRLDLPLEGKPLVEAAGRRLDAPLIFGLNLTSGAICL